MSMHPALAFMPARRRVLQLVGAAGIFCVAGCGQNKPHFNSVDITAADYGQGFVLADHNGQQRTLDDFSGKVVVLFFGYTQCPDVCPSTMLELVEVKKLLGADGDKLQALFVTLDPERDTPELLRAYMTNFDPTFVALRPTPEQLPALTKAFKIYFKKVPGAGATNYTLDHSAGSYVFDTQGHLRLFTRYGSGAAVLAADLAQLMR